MDKLNNDIDGGFPLTNDDLTFIENNAMDVSADIIKGFIGNLTSAIVFGGDITVTNSGGASPILNITEGALFYIDEIYQIEAVTQSLPSGTTLQNILDNWEWDLDETTDTPVTYKNATVNDAYKYRKAKLKSTPITWSGVLATTESVLELITVPQATEDTAGVLEISTQAEVEAGTRNDSALTPSNAGTSKTVTLTAGTDTLLESVVLNRYNRVGDNVTLTLQFDVTALTTNSIRVGVSPSTLISSLPEFFSFAAKVSRTTGTFDDDRVIVQKFGEDLLIRLTDENGLIPWTANDKMRVYLTTSYLL